jgi:translation elongation factor EF-G
LTLKYLEGEAITNEELKGALRRAVIAGQATAVYCGSSLRNKGVQPLLDAIIDFLPSPLDVPPVDQAWIFKQKKRLSAPRKMMRRSAPWFLRLSPILMWVAWPISGSIRAN